MKDSTLIVGAIVVIGVGLGAIVDQTGRQSRQAASQDARRYRSSSLHIEMPLSAPVQPMPPADYIDVQADHNARMSQLNQSTMIYNQQQELFRRQDIERQKRLRFNCLSCDSF